MITKEKIDEIVKKLFNTMYDITEYNDRFIVLIHTHSISINDLLRLGSELNTEKIDYLAAPGIGFAIFKD